MHFRRTGHLAFKRVRQAIAFVLVGAVITLLLAWGCALWSDRTTIVENGVGPRGSPGSWAADIVAPADRAFLANINAPLDDLGCVYRTTFGLDRRAIVPNLNSPQTWMAMRRGSTLMPAAVETRAGWPASALHAWQWLDPAGNVGSPFLYDSPLVITIDPGAPGTAAVRRVLPTGIIWSGFLFNTFTFAAACFAVVRGCGLARQVLRYRAGCCCRCAYPIGVSPRCTECGASIPQMRRRVAMLRSGLISLRWCAPAGLVLSLLLAGACAMYAPTLYESKTFRRVEARVWWSSVNREQMQVRRVVGLGFVVDEHRSGSWGCNVVRGGWPMSALEHAVEFWQGRATRVERTHGGRLLWRWLRTDQWDRKYLPIRPKWRGIGVNAMVWTAILVVAIMVVKNLRSVPASIE
jgi:hypothetical protein